MNIEADMVVLILCGDFRSWNKSASSLWDADTDFRRTMSLQTFDILSRAFPFNDHHTKAAHSQHGKLARNREVWQWMERLPLIYKPSLDFNK